MATDTSGDGATALSDTQQPDTSFRVPARTDLSVCAHAWKPAPGGCYDMHDAVQIKICDTGKDQSKTYLLPRGLLTWHSSYFAAALDPDSDLSEIKNGKTPCLEETIEVFDVFVNWLWTGRLKDEPSQADAPDCTADNLYLEYKLLCAIWFFGDMRGVPAFCNAAIDMVHERETAEWYFPLDILKFAYEGTSSGSLLRAYLVDNTVVSMSTQDLVDDLDPENASAQYLLDVMPKMGTAMDRGKILDREAWTKIDRCKWHDHSGPGGNMRLASRK